ncbi:DUF6942 family protein [Alteromonas sp. AMM-1]|uniref:DUF6942 family protein n=1 Tax=Alteromonas sp. AMM-1 TaxID=3394233 RepID=UPI0039A4BBF3
MSMIDLTSSKIKGLGDSNARMRVFIANRPAFSLQRLGNGIVPLTAGDIDAIGKACGNGWRKVFNVYAKFLFALPDNLQFKQGNCWQQFRDTHLLQGGSNTALMFGEPNSFEADTLNIITGRTFAQSTNVAQSLYWVTPEFAINTSLNLVVCPYFDYRQLSNSKILYLVDLIHAELNVHAINK